MKPSREYPPRLAALLARERLPALDAGTPDEEVRPALASLTAAEAFAPHAVRDADMAAACLAGLWLRFDFLDASHRISQEIETPAGSFWHAIMHRREGDYGNSKYWFRRVGAHAVYEPLRMAAAELAAAEPGLDRAAGFLAAQSRWDPFAFIDLVERSVSPDAACHGLCRRVQRAEWELLFHDCYRNAVGA